MAGPSQQELSQRAHDMCAVILDTLSGKTINDLGTKMTNLVRGSEIGSVRNEFPYDGRQKYIPGIDSMMAHLILFGGIVEKGFGSGRYYVRDYIDLTSASETLSSQEFDYLRRSANSLI